MGNAISGRATRVRRTITVNAPVEEVYRFWHDLSNLPRFMRHLESVIETGADHSHWTAKSADDHTIEWDAVVIDDHPNAVIAWRSVEGSEVKNEGVVRFVSAPRGQGTEVSVDLSYDVPGGAIGALAARLMGKDPARQVSEDLRAFKQVLETGEVLKSDATVTRTPHPAQPLADDERTQREEAR
jgi:uncharacterized membrane protein